MKQHSLEPIKYSFLYTQLSKANSQDQVRNHKLQQPNNTSKTPRHIKKSNRISNSPHKVNTHMKDKKKKKGQKLKSG